MASLTVVQRNGSSMSRREIVLLVSRAIALLQIIAALIVSFISLPVQVFLISQRFNLRQASPATNVGLSPMEWMPIISTLAHIGVLLVVAVLFWNCDPMIERLLLPAGSGQKAADEQV